MLRNIIIVALVLTLVVSATLAWYINNLGIWGMEFNTGNIDFNTYVYDENGALLVGPVSSDDENESKYINAPLITINNAEVGSTCTAYIAVESTGSIGIQYRIAFDISGRTESSEAYLGGYKYKITKVTDTADFDCSDTLGVADCARPENIDGEVVTIDRNAVNGTIEKKNGYDVYRVDFTLVHKNEEYTGGGINIYFNIFATQIDGDFEDDELRGYTYYCSTREDIDRARVEAYPGDIIKLSSNIIYYGDLVFNKPVHLETNDFTLTVNGNLMYDYTLGNNLRIDAGGLGKIIVQCTKEGVGGNFRVKAPLSEVIITGSNAADGDIVVEKNITVDATNSFGSAGVSFNEVRIVDLKNLRKTVRLESNTRATVSFGTTIGVFQSVGKANNIEIVNNGEIGEIDLSGMSLLDQTNSPQIYILNNNDINNPIKLPSWSVKFQKDAFGKCTGNTRIVQSYSGSSMTVDGVCDFGNDDIEVEKKDFLVEQIEEGNDGRLRIYYQDIDGQTTTIQSILEDYLKYEATTGCAVYEVLQLEIVSVGDKAITNDDIAFMNSDNMLSLKYLDMQRANMYDKSTDTYHKLPNSAFSSVTKYETLVLPQNLVEIGTYAFYNSKVDNIVTIPSGVTIFGSNWFHSGNYVGFAASVPVAEASAGLLNTKAVFVEEAYIASYKSVYSSYSTRIYPVSVLDESKTHFVRNTKADEWEITYYISGEDAVIGENITIDGTVLKITSIYDNAYRHNFTGTQVRFADTVENLGAGNFYGSKTVTSAELNNIKYVGDEAFYNCAGLAQVGFGNYLETIGASAFYNCVSLSQDVLLPDTMQKIGASAFQRSKITSVNTGGTTSIDDYAFAYCSGMIYAELPNVKVAGNTNSTRVFQFCDLLVSVKMPSLTTVNGYGLFLACSSLREVYMSVNNDELTLGDTPFGAVPTATLKLYVPEEYIEFYRNKCPGGISATKIYPQGEKMGEELVNGFNIGTYIVSENDDGTYTLITSNIGYTDSLVIPESYNGKAITHIYDNAFRNQSFTNVTLDISNSLTSIGNSAFYGLSGLVKIDFGDSLKVIGDSAFAYCTSWDQDAVLPDSMESIGIEAFRNTGISSINTGGTTFMDSRVFYNCTSLVYAIMPEVTEIGSAGNNEFFTSCNALVSVDLPKLSSVNISFMFRACPLLSELYLGSDNAGVSLGGTPFLGTSTAQIKLYVPSHLVSFYQGKNFVSANQVYPRGEKVGDKSVNGFVVGDYIVLDNGDGYTLVTSNLEFTGTTVVPNEYNGKPITEIYANAFRNQSFTDATLILGNNVKVIGTAAFYGRTGLKSVVMDRVTTIGADAFYGSGIQVLNAPDLTDIGNNAFRNCTSLEIVNLPKLTTVSSTYVFAGCTSLKSVYFENVMSLNQYTFNGDNSIEKITINRLINSNGDNMPSAMTIESAAPCKIYVPYRALSAYSATWSGKPVVSFDISATNNGNTFILADNNGRYTLIDFIPGQAVADFTMPSTVYSADIGNISIYAIDGSAFTAVSATLKNLTLSSTVALLNGTALSECAALENIYVASGNMYYISVGGVLYSTDAKMLVKYPAGRSGAFDMSGDAYASTVGISANAFANAANLTQIVFPETLMVIDSTAFESCKQLSTVEFTGDTPPVLMGAGIFDTSVDNFEMVIPTTDGDVVLTYLCAFNFGEYEPYIDLNGHAGPDADTPRNQVPLGDPAVRNNTYAMISNIKTDEEDEEALPEEEDETDGE